MIIRVSEAYVRRGKVSEFLGELESLVSSFPGQYDGLISHEVMVDRADDHRIRYISRWRDEAALASYAGAAWETTPVTFPGESELLEGPLSLSHFTWHPLG